MLHNAAERNERNMRYECLQILSAWRGWTRLEPQSPDGACELGPGVESDVVAVEVVQGVAAGLPCKDIPP